MGDVESQRRDTRNGSHCSSREWIFRLVSARANWPGTSRLATTSDMTPAQLIAQVPQLPAPSPGVLRLVTLLANEAADGQEIFDAVRQDALLSAKLLRLCNSAACGRSTPAASVDQAIIFLGQDEVRRLITALGVAGNLSPAMPGYAIGAG